MSGNNVETQFLELNTTNGWTAHYQEIRMESAKFSNTCLEAIKPQNKNLNRYRDVNPFDHSRIVLQRGSSDYINANLIKVEQANRQYILTQGPLCNTIGHFWLMVWEQESMAVLMLNKLIEKKQEKCFQYWPSKVGREHMMKLDDVGLTLEYVEHQDHSYYLTRILRLTEVETGDSRDILQFHYTTWPDFGVPSSPTAFIEFLRKVREAGVLESSVGPAVVHCSAGIGRSGTFCLVDSCLVLIKKYGLNAVDVKEILLEMRRYRMGLIQTPEQLRFSYQAIIEGAKQLSLPCPDTENCNTEIIINDISSEVHSSDEEEEPPPLPPRLDSLNRHYNGPPIDRPLPNIPISVSISDIAYEILEETQIPPRRPLPYVPREEEDESSEDELLDDMARADSPISEKSDRSDVSSLKDLPFPTSDLRQRQRAEKKEQLAAQIRDMKRRQQASEQWTQLKRPKTSLRD